uniref:Uncharacterized protein n=1 Tax=Helicotheca tamesis TaxID=374047 RepID=A0A7S2H9W9_9STRA
MPTHDDNLDKLEEEEEGSSIFCCCRSRNTYESKFDTADDSVHVMIAHDKKRASDKGEKFGGYVPRAPHPCIAQKSQANTADTEEKSTEAAEKNGDSPAEENGGDQTQEKGEEENVEQSKTLASD